MERYQDIFDFIIRQEAAYARSVKLPTGKMWNMKDHINRSALYRDSDIVGEKDKFTPIKNITRPILNLQYRTEDIDVKDVQLYVDDSSKYHLSFLVKKYHDDVFVVEHDLDTFFDELNQSRVTFGAGLSKSLASPVPESVPLQSIAFCDQRDILSRPIGLKHSYSPDELLGMASKGWGEPSKGATASLKEVIRLSRENPRDGVSEGDIEVYEVHGSVPKRFANPSDESEEYETRLFICCFYQKKDSMEKTGITLYTAIETESPFKLVKRDPIYGRALGFGGAEEIFEPQVWTNYAMIRELHMLDSASKTILKASGATSATIANKNNINNLENNQIIDVGEGDLSQVDTFPRNIKLFDNSVQQWEAHAQQMGAANDSIMGENPSSGTPFKLQELVTAESHGLHDYRRGQYAKHLEEIYKDWIIPHIEKKICQGATFLSELSLEELQYVTEKLVTNETNKMIKRLVLNGEDITPELVEEYKQQVTESFKKKGTKHFIEILKGEFKGASLGVKVNIAGKQKNLAARVDKLTNVIRTVMAAPQLLATPAMANIFNQILEASGLDPVDFSDFKMPAEPQQQTAPQEQPQASPLQLTAPANG
jgi:hypothetical protein